MSKQIALRSRPGDHGLLPVGALCAAPGPCHTDTGCLAYATEQSGAERPAEHIAMNDARTMLASAEDALWAGGPPQPSIEQQVVHEKERELFRQERRGDGRHGDLG